MENGLPEAVQWKKQKRRRAVEFIKSGKLASCAIKERSMLKCLPVRGGDADSVAVVLPRLSSQTAAPRVRKSTFEVVAVSTASGSGVVVSSLAADNDTRGAEIRVDIEALFAGDGSINRKDLCAEVESCYGSLQAMAQYALSGRLKLMLVSSTEFWVCVWF